MEDQCLEEVHVSVECEDPEFEVIEVVPCASLPYNISGKVYVIVQFPDDRPELCITTFTNTLKFVVKECDGSTPLEEVDGIQDEYQLEDFSLTIADSVQRVMKANFSASWEELGPDNELEETYALNKCKTIEETIKLVVGHLGMQPCDRSDRVTEGKSSHLLLLAGIFRGGHEVLVQCKLALVSAEMGVTLKLLVRSSDELASRIVADAIG